MSKHTQGDLYQLAESIAPGLSCSEYDQVVDAAMRALEGEGLEKMASKTYKTTLMSAVLDALDKTAETLYAETHSITPEEIHVYAEEDLDWSAITQALKTAAVEVEDAPEIKPDSQEMVTEPEQRNTWSESSKTYVEDDDEDDLDHLTLEILKEQYPRQDKADGFDEVNNSLKPRTWNDFSIGRQK